MQSIEQPAGQPQPTEAFEQRVELAFAPLHKRCLGLAMGSTLAAFIFLVTLWHRLRSPSDDYPLNLLDRYFAGYSVSLVGAFIGSLWGFWVGFCAGWFFAISRNAFLAASRIFFHAKAELSATRGFLDDI